MRFALTAQTVARDRLLNRPQSDITAKNVRKVTRYREGGKEGFEEMIDRFTEMEMSGAQGTTGVAKKAVYLGGRGESFYQARGRASKKAMDKDME